MARGSSAAAIGRLFAGLAAGLTVALIHEIFDFSLQTPANMVLFTVLLAAMLRLAMTKGVARPVACVAQRLESG